MPLFVVLREGGALDDELVGEIRRRVREDCSPRHVPNEIRAIPAVPADAVGQGAGGAGQADPVRDAGRAGGVAGVAGQPRGAGLLRGAGRERPANES